MVGFIIGLIFIIAAIVSFCIVAYLKKTGSEGFGSFITGCITGFIGLVLVLFGCFYCQDPGDVAVLRNFGGSIAGSSSEPGIHFKAPWQDVIKYDIRNNVISYQDDHEESYNGGSANGYAVSINDASGTSATINLQVNYSLDPNQAIRIYEEYGTQENFVRYVAAVDCRAIPREVCGRFDTITILTNRGDYSQAIQDALAEKWNGLGLEIEQVSVQSVKYPQEITDRYAAAQSSEIDRQKAINQQEVTRVEAENRVIEARGIADANAILQQSLTDQVISQKYIDALVEIGKQGNLIITSEGSTPLINVK